MNAQQLLDSLREKPVALIECEGYSVLWRFVGGTFYRMAVSTTSWRHWEPYGDEAARTQVGKDLEAAI